ncbi:transcription factor Adf-1-like [Pararge aegeria]|uniref:Jg9238 protein n=1 Tax=Pararge aegeria aegeria TaxID=348720 RepID=A0A8S4SPY5_9NEOP|nr:transcription factor Adf-1-like [Pararge aegeria]CAH2268702.1 jg9238 [Pararge aegeria aegeria]
MYDEKLIECVKKYPVLYDMSDPKYLDSKYKISVWTAIASEINETSNACKNRWTNIRDQFKRNLNKRKTKSGQAVYIKKYKYEEELEFLLPHIQNRNTVSNEYESVSEESRHDIESNETAENDYDVPIVPLTDNRTHNHSTSQSTLQNITQVNASQSRKRHRNHASRSLEQPSASVSQTIMEYIINNNKEKAENLHPIDAFLKGLAPTVKQFSPYYQHLARGRIFQVVQDLELEQLSAEPKSFAVSSPLQSSPNQSPESPHSQSQ